MLAKWIEKSRSGLPELFGAVQTKQNYNILDAYKTVSGDRLPHAPHNPYRKRPMKLTYDKNEYHWFRLPSEQHFLMQPFDYDTIFGRREGINHSPAVRSQLNLDSNLVWLYFLFTILALGTEFRQHNQFVTLRQNHDNSDMGVFTVEDFK